MERNTRFHWIRVKSLGNNTFSVQCNCGSESILENISRMIKYVQVYLNAGTSGQEDYARF